MGWMVNLGKDTLYTLYRRLGGSQGRSRRVRKISSSTGIRSPVRPTRSKSLYRLSYWRPSNVKQSLSTAQAAMAEDCSRPWVSPRGICGGQWHWVCEYRSTNAPYLSRLQVCFQDKWKKPGSLLAQWCYSGRKQLYFSHLLLSLSHVSLSFSFCRFYYFLSLSVSVSLFASLFHYPS